MKKTIKISLQGSVFHIDEDAYSLLKKYLAEIGDYFHSREEAEEIMQDIESRIAEIFNERLQESREVVNLADVEYMISQLGKPADIFGEGEEGEFSEEMPHEYHRRRLYRDPENSVLGGVCGGLGAYFDIDPVWFRVFFVLLMLGYGVAFLIYILLWIILPEARTSTQRLEMKGEEVNVNNIGRRVSREFHKVKDNLKDVPSSAAYVNTRNALQEFFHVVGQILLLIVKIIAVIIGIAFVIAGITTLITLVGTLFFRYHWAFPGDVIYPPFYLPDFLVLFTSPENIPYIIASMILTIGIPLLALIYGGVRMIFRIRTGNRAVGLTFFILWLISVVSLSFFALDIGSNFSDSANLHDSVEFDLAQHDTLYIAASSFYPENMKEVFSFDRENLYWNEAQEEVYTRPEIEVSHSDRNIPELEIYRYARGRNRDVAIHNAEAMRCEWTRDGNHLYIDPWVGLGNRYYGQEFELRFRIPENTVVCFDENLKHVLQYISNENGYRGYNMAGKCWIMSENRLRLAD